MPLPSPVALWHEESGSGAAMALAVLRPYKTSAGYWVFVATGAAPAGATAGALVSGSYDTLLTSTTSGLRLARRPDDSLMAY